MIKAVNKENLEQVLPLIRAYQTFYKVADICDDNNRTFFSQFCAEDSSENSPLGCQFAYYEDSDDKMSNSQISNRKMIAFATVYFSFTSTITAKVSILNDLFVLPEYRGKGIGRELIEHCHDYAKRCGAARLQWLTTPDNTQAQKLYVALDTKKSEWVFYSYSHD